MLWSSLCCSFSWCSSSWTIGFCVFKLVKKMKVEDCVLLHVPPVVGLSAVRARGVCGARQSPWWPVSSHDRHRVQGRRERVEARCSSVGKGRAALSDILADRQLVLAPHRRLLHCPVPKVASTFWYRFLSVLNATGEGPLPYSQPLGAHLPARSPRLRDAVPDHRARLRLVRSAFKAVFVRDPYARMLSAYVDKTLAPNPTYWALWGKVAVKRFRPHAQPLSLRCGHDVTFAELLAYVNQRLHRHDPHFQPVSKLCLPCAFHYDLVGKMETFPQDVATLAQILRLPSAHYFASAQFRQDYARDAIEDSILSPFSWMEEIVQCMSKHEAGRRIWRKLQIRGLISRRFPFPFSRESFQNMTAPQFLAVAMDRHEQSRDKAELKQQKQDALAEAYSTVDMGQLRTLTAALTDDFLMFGYDPRPKAVFQPEGAFNTGAFDWDTDW